MQSHTEDSPVQSPESNDSPKQPQQHKIPKMIIVKYFEEHDKYAKVVPRTLLSIVKARIQHMLDAVIPTDDEEQKRLLLQLHMTETTHLKGSELINLILNDDAWLQKNNPVCQVLSYDPRSNQFEQVLHDDAFAFDRKKRENIFTFHVKRKIPVDRILIQSTLLFSDRDAAEDWVAEVYNNPHMAVEKEIDAAASIRYLDIHHNGYTRLYNVMRIPIERTGKSLIKIMLEKRVPDYVLQQTKKEYELELQQQQQIASPSTATTTSPSMNTSNAMGLRKISMNFDEGFDDIFDDDEEYDYNYVVQPTNHSHSQQQSHHHHSHHHHSHSHSDTVDLSHISSCINLNKIPTKSFMEHVTNDKQKLQAWLKLKIPTKHSDVSDQLKKLIRKGIPESRRREAWLGVTGAMAMIQSNPKLYENCFQKCYSNYSTNGTEVKIETVDPKIYAEFGGKLETVDSVHCYLNQEGFKSAKRILCVLADANPDVEFCPNIPSLVSLLLMKLNESEAFATVHGMLAVSRKVNWYLRTNKMQHALFLEGFKDLIQKKLPKVATHMEQLGFVLSELATVWFEKLFVNHLPLHFVLRFLDGFMNEGCKLLYRCGFAILKTFENQIVQCKSVNDLELLLHSEKNYESWNENEFFNIAYGLGLQRKQLQEFEEKNKSSLDMSKISTKSTTFVKPKINGHSEIIKEMGQWELLFSWLPVKMRVRKCSLVFSTSKDGYSLNGMYSRCNDIGPHIIIIHAKPNLSDDPDNLAYWDSLGEKPEFVDLELEAKLKAQKEEESKMDLVDLIKSKKAEGISLRKQIKEEEERLKQMHSNAHSNAQKKLPKMNKDELCIFGAYSGDSLEKTSRFEGTTDTMLYSLYPSEVKYGWTRKNDYFRMARPDKLIFGSGGEGAGLQFDDMLQHGTSQRCLTFENQPLPIVSVLFTILKVEVWNFD